MLNIKRLNLPVKSHSVFTNSALGLIIFCSMYLEGCATRYDGMPASVANRTAQSMQVAGTMRSNEFLDMLEMRDKLASGGSLSENDVDWLLSVASRPGSSAQNESRIKQVGEVLATARPDKIPSSRRERVFNYAVELSSNNASSSIIPLDACYIFAHLQDPRAKACLERLRSDQDIYVRAAAARSLKSLEN